MCIVLADLGAHVFYEDTKDPRQSMVAEEGVEPPTNGL